jgi:hypothetical protein
MLIWKLLFERNNKHELEKVLVGFERKLKVSKSLKKNSKVLTISSCTRGAFSFSTRKASA